MLPTTADGVMAPASFELFRKMAQPYQDQIEASKDGKLGYDDLRSDHVRKLPNLRIRSAP